MHRRGKHAVPIDGPVLKSHQAAAEKAQQQTPSFRLIAEPEAHEKTRWRVIWTGWNCGGYAGTLCTLAIAAALLLALFSLLISAGALRAPKQAHLPFYLVDTPHLILGPSLVPLAGDAFTITLEVNNDSPEEVANITVLDAINGIPIMVLCPPLYLSNMIESLAAGASATCTASYTLTNADVSSPIMTVLHSRSSASGIFVNSSTIALASAFSDYQLQTAMAPTVIVDMNNGGGGIIVRDCAGGIPLACNILNEGQTLLCNNTYELYQCSGFSSTWLPTGNIGGTTGPQGPSGTSTLVDNCTTAPPHTAIPCNNVTNMYLLFCGFQSQPGQSGMVYMCLQPNWIFFANLNGPTGPTGGTGGTGAGSGSGSTGNTGTPKGSAASIDTRSARIASVASDRPACCSVLPIGNTHRSS